MMPQNVAYEQLKQELINTTNYGLSDLRLPPFIVATILKDLYVETSNQAAIEYQQSLQAYTAAKTKEQPSKE